MGGPGRGCPRGADPEEPPREDGLGTPRGPVPCVTVVPHPSVPLGFGGQGGVGGPVVAASTPRRFCLLFYLKAHKHKTWENRSYFLPKHWEEAPGWKHATARSSVGRGRGGPQALQGQVAPAGHSKRGHFPCHLLSVGLEHPGEMLRDGDVSRLR